MRVTTVTTTSTAVVVDTKKRGCRCKRMVASARKPTPAPAKKPKKKKCCAVKVVDVVSKEALKRLEFRRIRLEQQFADKKAELDWQCNVGGGTKNALIRGTLLDMADILSLLAGIRAAIADIKAEVAFHLK